MIEPGDKVKHKDRSINNGWEMEVEEIEDGGAWCEHILEDGSPKLEKFPLEDLELFFKGNGGFKGEGGK